MWPFKKKLVVTDQAVPTRATVGDSLVNYVTGMGMYSRDQTTHSKYMPEVGIDRMTADAIFRTSWLGKRIVTTLAEDMTREWRQHVWDGSQDDDGVFDLELEETRLQVRKRVTTAIKWARQYGGSIILMVTKDAKDLAAFAEPLDVERVGKGDLLNLVVYDRWRIYGTPPERRDYESTGVIVPYLNQTLDDPNFGLPEYYYLSDTSVKVHHSRVVRFDGEELSYYEWMRNAMWHDSVYKSVLRALTSYDTLMAAASTLVTQANLDVLLAQDFADQLASNEGTTNALKRYELLNLMKSLFGLVVLDKDREQLDRKPLAALSGLRDLCDRFALDVSGAAGISVPRLFGQAPSGLNANGEANLVNDEIVVKAHQVSDLTPRMDQLDKVLVRSALGRMPDDYRFDWNPLRQMSDDQKSQIELRRAQRDKVYLDAKVLKREAVARELRASTTYPNMTQDDVNAAAEADEAPTPPPLLPFGGAQGGNGKSSKPPVPGAEKEDDEGEGEEVEKAPTTVV